MYVSYMHVHMYMYWRADTARMRIRRTGSLGPYIGTRRRVVCVRACVRACARYVGQEMPSCPGNVVGCAGDSSCEDCPTWLPLTAQLLRLLRGSSEFSKCQWQDNKCGVGMKRESRFKIK